MKTLYFLGISDTGFSCSLMLVNPNISCETKYYYGFLEITFNLKDRKEIGKAIKRTFKRKNFKVVKKEDI